MRGGTSPGSKSLAAWLKRGNGPPAGAHREAAGLGDYVEAEKGVAGKNLDGDSELGVLEVHGCPGWFFDCRADFMVGFRFHGLIASIHYGINNTLPVVFRPSSWRWASAASFKAKLLSTRSFNSPLAIHLKRSPER